jgi:hypothetical protein
MTTGLASPTLLIIGDVAALSFRTSHESCARSITSRRRVAGDLSSTTVLDSNRKASMAHHT